LGGPPVFLLCLMPLFLPSPSSLWCALWLPDCFLVPPPRASPPGSGYRPHSFSPWLAYHDLFSSASARRVRLERGCLICGAVLAAECVRPVLPRGCRPSPLVAPALTCGVLFRFCWTLSSRLGMLILLLALLPCLRAPGSRLRIPGTSCSRAWLLLTGFTCCARISMGERSRPLVWPLVLAPFLQVALAPSPQSTHPCSALVRLWLLGCWSPALSLSPVAPVSASLPCLPALLCCISWPSGLVLALLPACESPLLDFPAFLLRRDLGTSAVADRVFSLPLRFPVVALCSPPFAVTSANPSLVSPPFPGEGFSPRNYWAPPTIVPELLCASYSLLRFFSALCARPFPVTRPFFGPP